jgi:glycine/serine hydroxymethyltransferase
LTKGVAVALKDCLTESFQKYSAQVVTNSKVLCQSMIDKGYKVATGN